MDMKSNQYSPVQVFEQIPILSLRPFIRRFLIVEFPPLHHDIHLPDTGTVAAFSFRGGCRINQDQSAPTAAFTGLHETVRAHEHYQNHSVLLATFTPVGASAFLGPSLDEFAGTTADLAAILGHPDGFERLHEQLAEAENHEQRIRFLENFLYTRLRVSEPDPLITAAVAWLEHSKGARKIGDLTRYIGLSQSALERRFRRVVGISPKKFASVIRLRNAVRLRATGADFAAVAQAAGYFDQSHFIKAFRRATGSAPERFFRRFPAH